MCLLDEVWTDFTDSTMVRNVCVVLLWAVSRRLVLSLGRLRLRVLDVL